MSSELKIKVPVRFSDNFGEPFIELLKIIEQLNQIQNLSDIQVDFTENKFAGPFYLGPLSCILQGLKSTEVNINVQHSSSYLETILFPFGFSDLKNEGIEEKFKMYHQKTYTPIIHFPTSLLKKESDKRDSVISALNSILKTQLNLPINILQAFYYFIDELTQNVVDHSDVNSGTVFAQYYPEKNYLDLCICDKGKGIYQTYIDSGKQQPKNNTEAINFAIYGKSTKDIPESRGFGLNTTRKMLTQGLGGKFLLFSGSDAFIQTNKREEIIPLQSSMAFSGCIINLRIPVFNLSSFTIHSFIDI